MTTITRKPTVTAAENFAAADALAKQAKAAADEARKALVSTIREDEGNVDIPLADGRTVSVSDRERVSIDADLLADLIPADIFHKVTKIAVDVSLFRKAEDLGDIDADEVAAAVKVTEYIDVRVSK